METFELNIYIESYEINAQSEFFFSPMSKNLYSNIRDMLFAKEKKYWMRLTA